MTALNYSFQKIRLTPSLPEIYPIGIGTWAWGDKFYWSLGAKKIDFTNLEQAYAYCLESEVNFFDTAEVYAQGRSEKTLNRFMKNSQEKISIATKFFPYPWRRSASFRRALKNSLKRLGEEYVDLYQIHWPSPAIPIPTQMNLMADAIEEGLIKAVGVSNFNLEQTSQAMEILARRGLSLASNQIVFNLIQRQHEISGLIDFCIQNGVTVIAYSPIAQGILTGKFTPENPPPGIRGLMNRKKDLIRYQPLLDAMKPIADQHQATLAQVAINWTLCKNTLPIPGVKSLKQAKDNIGALTFRLDQNEIQKLDAIILEIQ